MHQLQPRSTIRRAVVKDVPAIANVIAQSRAKAYGLVSGDVYQALVVDQTAPAGLEELRTMVLGEQTLGTAVWVMDVGDTTVGVLIARQFPDHTYLDRMFLLPAYQGLGLGSQLMNMLFAWADKAVPIYLGVVKANKKAIGFYQKHGFGYVANTEEQANGMTYITMKKEMNI